MLRAIIISLALMLPAIMTAKESYVIQDSPDGPCLVKWIGKESVVDFNRSPALRSVKVIGEMAFEMNNHIPQAGVQHLRESGYSGDAVVCKGNREQCFQYG